MAFFEMQTHGGGNRSGVNVPFYVIARPARGGPWQSQSLDFR